MDNNRSLYNNNFIGFLSETTEAILGKLCDSYHGNAQTTTIEAWKGEISIMKATLSCLEEKNGQIIFEYDIPRLSKRIDVVMLYKGIIFCIEFKVGENRIMENDIDQVLDYALDLNYFHKFSQDKVIVPILVATNYNNASTFIQKSGYADKVINPLVTGKSNLITLINKVIHADDSVYSKGYKEKQRRKEKEYLFCNRSPRCGKDLSGTRCSCTSDISGTE